MIALILLALGLSADAFAVAVAAGVAARDGAAPALRLGVAFGIAQGVMPLLGWLAASVAGSWFTSVDHWIAFGLLAVLGGRMIKAGLDGGNAEASFETRSLSGLLIASLATSTDAAAAGLTLPALNVPVLLSCAIIGVTTAIVSTAGAQFGQMLGVRFGARAEIAGGAILIGIGAQILFAHLNA